MLEALVPFWLKLVFVGFLLVLVPAYWRIYGAANFLWLSDIGLFVTALAILSENPLLASMTAIGVMPLEIAWTLDFIARGRLLRVTGYMFDRAIPLWVRALSLFHLALPPLLIWFLYRFGYDARAVFYQTALTWIVLSLSYLFAAPDMNVNWVFGPGDKPQRRLPRLLYFALVMAIFPFALILPMHLLMRGLFG